MIPRLNLEDNMKKHLLWMLFTIVALLFSTTACGSKTNGPDVTENTISTKAINGVGIPKTMVPASTAIQETNQFTGTISWKPALSGGKFAANTVYTATITLTPKKGFRVKGVAKDFFTVSGAKATNPKDSGVIEAVFPATGGTSVNVDLSSLAITPATGADPVREVDMQQYKIKIDWTPPLAAGAKFVLGQTYTATITFDVLSGLDLVIDSDMKYTGAVSTTYNSGDKSFTVVFHPTTAAGDHTVAANVSSPYEPTIFSAETTELIFTFSEDPGNIQVQNITISNGTGSATKGVVSGSGTTRTLTVSDIISGDIKVSISGVSGVNASAKTVQVYGEQDLRDILDAMSPTQRARQLAQISNGDGVPGAAPYNWGSIFTGGGDYPSPAARGNNNTPANWSTGVLRYVNGSYELDVFGTMTKIPIIFGVDAVHGFCNSQNQTIFMPHNIGIGAIAHGDLEKGKKAARERANITAEQLRASNIRQAFNPCLSVPENPRYGRFYEGFSSDENIVAALGLEEVRGFQNNGVAATIKHYIGEGQSWGNSNIMRANVTLTYDRFIEVALPFRTAIESWALMPAYNGVVITGGPQGSGSADNTAKAHMHKWIKRTYFKEELGYNGCMDGDWNEHSTNPVLAIDTGLDLMMTATAANATAVQNGSKQEYIDDAVMRVLRLKKRVKLLGPDQELEWEPGVWRTDENVAKARDMAADSMTLLRNKNNLIQDIQAGKFKNIMVAGRASEGDTGRGHLCGAWTITWQGNSDSLWGANSLPTVTVYEGIRAAVNGKDGITVTSSAAGNAPGNFDLVIAVISETGYAEGDGELPGNSGKGGYIQAADQTMLNNVYAKGAKVLVIAVTGRPIVFNSNGNGGRNKSTEHLKWDGLIAAWLPGIEGGNALADVLFTDREFVGKTPQPWYEAIVPPAGQENGPPSSWDLGNLMYPIDHGLRKTDAIDTDMNTP